jgi:hypothetical protein
MPDCGASNLNVLGKKALSVATLSYTRRKLSKLQSQVDPTTWSHCPAEWGFFKSVTKVPGTEKSLVSPDAGWNSQVREEVDFGFGLPGMGTSQCVDTGLAFVVFDGSFDPNPSSPPTAPTTPPQYKRCGCTYDLVPGGDGKITVDQGFILIEDLMPDHDVRRYRTLKVVYFDGVAQPEDVCFFWSIASALITHFC